MFKRMHVVLSLTEAEFFMIEYYIDNGYKVHTIDRF